MDLSPRFFGKSVWVYVVRGITPHCCLRYLKEATNASAATNEAYEAGGDFSHTKKLIAPYKAAPVPITAAVEAVGLKHVPRYATGWYFIPALLKGGRASRALYDLSFQTTKLVRHKHKENRHRKR